MKNAIFLIALSTVALVACSASETPPEGDTLPAGAEPAPLVAPEPELPSAPLEPAPAAEALTPPATTPP
ncbi:hypothetical protein ABW22_07965, partial [Thiobacillus denitrificans]